MRKTISKSLPTGWIVAGSNPEAYDMGICEDVYHSGTRCAQIRCVDKSDDGFGTLMQTFDATKYRGKRVKLSAFVRCQNVSRWSGLWLRVDAGTQMVSFDNMQDRPICGDQDWQSYDIILNVPESSTGISFGILLAGPGQVWLDDVELTVVDLDVKPTGTLDRSCGVRYQNDMATNLDFSRGIDSHTADVCLQSTPVGWFNQMSKTGAYTFGLAEHSVAGDVTDATDASSAFIKSTDLEESNNWGALLQSVDTRPFFNKHARLTGWIKTADVSGTTGLWLRADAGTQLRVCWDYMEGREIEGTTDWTKYECVIEIPRDSDNIYFGAVLNGSGTVWVKDFALEAVDKRVATTGDHGAPSLEWSAKPMRAERVTSHDPTLKSWYLTGNGSENYTVGIDPPLDPDGQDCRVIESSTAGNESFGTLMQSIDAESFVGKSVKVSANIKTSNVHWVGLWVRVDGARGEVLAFDNMQKRPIVGSKDWARYETVLDVSDEGRSIAYGVLLCGAGKVWIADVHVDCVATIDGPAKVDNDLYRRSEPINLDFES